MLSLLLSFSYLRPMMSPFIVGFGPHEWHVSLPCTPLALHYLVLYLFAKNWILFTFICLLFCSLSVLLILYVKKNHMALYLLVLCSSMLLLWVAYFQYIFHSREENCFPIYVYFFYWGIWHIQLEVDNKQKFILNEQLWYQQPASMIQEITS